MKIPLLSAYFRKREENKVLQQARVDEDRKKIIGELESKVKYLDLEIQRINEVTVPSQEQYGDREVLQSYFKNLHGEEDGLRLYERFVELEDLTTYRSDKERDFIWSIHCDYKDTYRRGFEEDSKLYKKAIERIKTSKNPSKDFQKLKDYIKETQQYEASMPESFCHMGMSSPPELPKFMRD